MTLEECYKKMHADYETALSILMNDRLIEKFMFKFLEDNTFKNLSDSVKNKDSHESFRGAHTLKGVAANLGFEELRKAASDLTEQLRGTDNLADETLYKKVEESYYLVINTIKEYANEKA